MTTTAMAVVTAVIHPQLPDEPVVAVTFLPAKHIRLVLSRELFGTVEILHNPDLDLDELFGDRPLVRYEGLLEYLVDRFDVLPELPTNDSGE